MRQATVLVRATIPVLALVTIGCGGGGGGGDDVPFLAGVYTGVLVEEARNCPFGVNALLGTTMTVNQDNRRIVAELGSLHFEGAVTSDESFTASNHFDSSPGCAVDSTMQVTDIDSSSASERLQITVQCRTAKCTSILRAQATRSAAVSRSLRDEKAFAGVFDELASAVAEATSR
jgi:hypothetical protein